ncbi:MAG: hemerythrin domain-containing protein [Actinomycetota bacterium]
MGRRHDSLLPLTHDHHHALKQARLLRNAADGSDEAALADAVAEFLSVYEGELLTHFREEEEELLPLLPPDDPDARELTTRTLLEHVELHRLARSLRQGLEHGAPDRGTAQAAAALLRAHIRMEEDRLFPLIERLVPDPDLSGVHLAPRERSVAAQPATPDRDA